MKNAKKKFALHLTIQILTVAALVIIGLSIGKPYYFPFFTTQKWDAPTNYSKSTDGADVIIDKGRTRVTISTSEDQDHITGVIGKVSGSGQTTLGQAAMTDGRYVYIVSLNKRGNTTAIASESVLKYDMQGNYIGVVAKKTWPEKEIHASPVIRDLYLNKAGQLEVILADGKQISFCHVNDKQEITAYKTVTIPDGTVFRCDENDSLGRLEIVTISGDIYTYDGETLTHDYTNTGAHLFNYAARGDDGKIYASDHNNGEICTVSPSGEVETLIASAYTEFLTPIKGGVVYGDESDGALHAVSFEREEAQSIESEPFAAGFILHYAVITLAYLWLIGMVVVLAVRLVIRRRKRPKTTESAGGQKARPSPLSNPRVRFFGAMLLSAFIIMCAFITSFTAKEQKEALSDIVRSATFFSSESDMTYGNALAQITTPADFNGEDYEILREYLNRFYDASVKTDKNTYYFLEKRQGDRLYVAADSTGHYQPGTSFESISQTEEKQQVFNGEVVTGENHDSWSTYRFAVAPVYDQDGAIVGCLETGMYSNLFSQQQLQDVFSIIIMTLTILMTAMVSLTELDGIRSIFRQRKTVSGTDNITSIYRPLCFFSYFCSALDITYMILILKKLTGDNGLGSNPMLPSTLLTIISAAALLAPACGAWLAARFPIKRLMVSALAVYAAACIGAGFCLMAGSLVLYCIIAFLLFFLQGILYVFQRVLSTAAKDNETRLRLITDNNSAYASVSVLGASLGGYVAQYLGYPAIYTAEAVIAGIAILICLFGLKDFGIIGQQASPSREKKKLGFSALIKFIATPRGVLPILLGACMISLIIGYPTYLFPLYAQSLGYDLVSIANVLAIASAISSICGSGLSDLAGRIGWRRSYVALLLILGVIMLFSVLNPAYGWSILFIVFVRIATSIGGAYENLYFIERGRAFGFSEAQSINVDVSRANIMMALRPIVFGWLLLGGYSSASMILFALMTASAVILLAMSAKQRTSSAAL